MSCRSGGEAPAYLSPRGRTASFGFPNFRFCRNQRNQELKNLDSKTFLGHFVDNQQVTRRKNLEIDFSFFLLAQRKYRT
jgi:hypothetical protein